MSRYSQTTLATRSEVIEEETLEIAHPNFTQIYRLVRNVASGNITTDAGTFLAFPLSIEKLSTQQGQLEVGFRITLPDLGEVLPRELDAVMAAGGMETMPSLIYRGYRSDDLTRPIRGPATFEIESFAFNWQGATFEAKTPSANTSRTGRVYTIREFPMLAGLV